VLPSSMGPPPGFAATSSSPDTWPPPMTRSLIREKQEHESTHNQKIRYLYAKEPQQPPPAQHKHEPEHQSGD
jgi:hypothetical protein